MPYLPRDWVINALSVRVICFLLICHNHACRSVHLLTWGLGTPTHIWFRNPQHVNQSLVELNEHAKEGLAKGKKLQHLPDLWAHTIDTSDPDGKCQFGFRRCIKLASFSWHPSHSNLSSVHPPTFLVIVLSFFIDKLPPCLSKQLLHKLLSHQILDLQLCEIPLPSLKGFCYNRELLLPLWTLHGPNQKRENIVDFKINTEKW